MFKSALSQLISYINGVSDHESLEQYIVAHDPQSNEDIERLEREFLEKQRQSNVFPFPFHE